MIGIVIYAFYSVCDPIKTKQIASADQVCIITTDRCVTKIKANGCLYELNLLIKIDKADSICYPWVI